MSRKSKRKVRAAADLHQLIRAAALEVRKSPFEGFCSVESEELAGLLRAALSAVDAAAPATFVHFGKSYRLRVQLAQ